jgi:hypothetical protein
MFLLPRKPFLAPPDGSSGFEVTKSIFDMMFIQGISKLTMADMADRTPLGAVEKRVKRSCRAPYLKNLYLSSINCDSIR